MQHSNIWRDCLLWIYKTVLWVRSKQIITLFIFFAPTTFLYFIYFMFVFDIKVCVLGKIEKKCYGLIAAFAVVRIGGLEILRKKYTLHFCHCLCIIMSVHDANMFQDKNWAPRNFCADDFFYTFFSSRLAIEKFPLYFSFVLSFARNV